MSLNFNSLKTNNTKEDNLFKYMQKTNDNMQFPQLFSTNQVVSSNGIYQNAFLLLVSTKEFSNMINIDILQNIPNQTEPMVAPETSGYDNFINYKECIDLTARLVSAVQKCKRGQDYISFIELFVTKRKIKSIFEFIKELIYVTDVAFTQLCLVQDKDSNDSYQQIVHYENNPLHQILSAKMMSTLIPFNCIYKSSKSSEFQKIIFDSITNDAFITVPKLVVFVHPQNSKIELDENLPKLISVPMNGNRESVLKVLGRIAAWSEFSSQNKGVDEKSQNVIEKYQKIYPVANYKLVGFVNAAYSEQEQSSTVSMANSGNIEVEKSEKSFPENPICVVYELSE